MPSTADDTVKKEVLYPDESVGEGLVARDEYGDDSAIMFWNAENGDQDVLPDGARYGWWLPVTLIGTDEHAWLASPRGLREAIVENGIKPGDAFRVIGCEKGPADHDPYEVEIEYPYET